MRRQRIHPYNLLAGLIAWVVMVYQSASLTASILCFVGAIVLQMVIAEDVQVTSSLRKGLRVLTWSVPLLAVYVFIQAVLSPSSEAPGHVFWNGPTIPELGTLTLTAGGLVTGAMVALRLWALLLGVMALTRLIRPDDVVIWLGKRFARAGLTISMIMTFLPLLQEEFGRLRDYIFARGAIVEGTSWLRRVRAMAAVLQALLMNALERSWNLAESMYVRGYGSTDRTFYRKASWRMPDTVVMIGWLLVIALAVGANRTVWKAVVVPLLGGDLHGGQLPLHQIPGGQLLGTPVMFVAALVLMFVMLVWLGGNLRVYHHNR